MKRGEKRVGRNACRSVCRAHAPTMPIHHQLAARGLILGAALLSAVEADGADSAQPAPWEQALACVQDSMTRCPAPWPQAWRREYAQTIRQVVTSHWETSHYDKRLTILCNGFRAPGRTDQSPAEGLSESALCFDESVSPEMQGRQSSNHQAKSVKGGDAYDRVNLTNTGCDMCCNMD